MRPLSHNLLIAAALLSLSAGAIAQAPGPQPMRGPGGPGRMAGPPPMPITRGELQARLTQMFDRLDVNKDGKLSVEDRQAHRQQAVDQRFAKIDTDKNGTISKQEFAADRPPRAMKAGGKGAAMKNGPDGSPRHGPGGREGRPHMMHAAMMPKMDGPISKADFIAKGLARFDTVDTNHDGTISLDERRAAHSKMPPPRPQTANPGQ